MNPASSTALPNSLDLPVEKLSAVFKHTTNSYKFYWFLAIIEKLKSDSNNQLVVAEIVIEMISMAWYPINSFRLSFGPLDQLERIISDLQSFFDLSNDIKRHDLIKKLKENIEAPIVQKAIMDISKYVPYRFLSPWFKNNLVGVPDTLKNRYIVKFSNEASIVPKHQCLYRFIESGKIEIGSGWFAYLKQHLNILVGFSLWHLTKYLQKNNPIVPNISDKLFPPQTRSLQTAKTFWNAYFEIKENKVRCLYSGLDILKSEFSIDHFLPWSFVAHDQLWNLVPTLKNINSSKGDSLPAIEYLARFSTIQFDAFNSLVRSGRISSKLLNDYSVFFKNDIPGIANLNESEFSEVMIRNIKPLMQIAINMGFPDDWTFSKIS